MADSPTLLAHDIARTVRQRIVEGVYAPETLMPTERSLAEEFGVSRGTVSTALSRLAEMGLLVQTRGRGTLVLSVDQRPTRKRVAVVAPRVEDHFSTEGYLIVEGAADRLAQLGYAVDHVPFYAQPHEAHTKKWGDRLIQMSHLHQACRGYDGVVFLECSDAVTAKAAHALEADRHPMVIANLEIDLPFSATRVDHYAVFRKATEMLIAFGHRNLALISRPFGAHFYSKAEKAFMDATAAAGLMIPRSRMVERPTPRALDGYLAMKALLESPHPPTAVVACRDSIAEGACHALDEAGLEVGRHVSIIAFDDHSSSLSDPFLTTFHEPCYELGVEAANMLDERLTYGWRPCEHRTVDAPLVLRQSAGPAVRAPAGEPREKTQGPRATRGPC